MRTTKTIGRFGIGILGIFLAGSVVGCAADAAEGGEDEVLGQTQQAASVVSPCVSNGSKDLCSGALMSFSDGTYVRYWRSHALSGDGRGIERAVVVVHGAARNPWAYFDHVQDAAALEGVRSSTIVIAPYFPTAEDAGSNERYWDENGWKQGDLDLKKKAISSFAVVDHIVGRLTDKRYFPDLKSIAISGHSAGGQFTQRYAAASPSPPAGYAIRYVVANPSSYMYLDDRRPSGFGFVHPLAATDRPCYVTSFNDYKYGLERANAYVRQNDRSTLISRYKSRNVIYLLGTADTSTEKEDAVDTSCPAKLQGSNRLERGRNFDAYMEIVHKTYHRRIEVVGVGHDGEAMFQSLGGRMALFR